MGVSRYAGRSVALGLVLSFGVAAGCSGAGEGSSSGEVPDASLADQTGPQPPDAGPDGTVADADAADSAVDGDSSTDGGGEAGLDSGPPVCTATAWDGPYDLPDGVCSISGICQTTRLPVWDSLGRVWAASASDVWMTGPGIVVHWDGVKWRGLTAVPQLMGPVVPIAGSGPNDVWIGGVLHWDGVKLAKAAKPAPGTPTAMWFAAANDGWSVNGSADAHHWDGATWTATPTGVVTGVSTVHGFAADDVWVGGGASVVHWTGAAWGAPANPFPAGQAVKVIGGAQPNDFWVGGSELVHYRDGVWTAYPGFLKNVRAITGNAADNIRFVAGTTAGGAGIVYRWDGAQFAQKAFDAPACTSCTTCTDAAMAANGALFVTTMVPAPSYNALCPAGGLGQSSFAPGYTAFNVTRIVETDGQMLSLAGTKIRRGELADQSVLWGITVDDVAVGLSSRGPNDVWATGYSGAANIASHYDGATWSYKLLPAKPTSAVGAASPTSAWVLTGTNAAYWDGATWTDKGSVGVTKVRAIWGASSSDAWAVGDGIVHWDGATWSVVAGAPTGLADVRGTSATDIVALQGSAATNTTSLYRWNGAAWSSVPGSSLPWRMDAAAMIGTNDIWVARGTSTDDRVMHWDGSCWRSQKTGEYGNGVAQAIGGSAAKVFVVLNHQVLTAVR